MINYIDEKRVHQLSLNDSDVVMSDKLIKLSEEVGECSSAYLKYKKSKNVSASAKGAPIDVIEEAGDTINVAMDIINAMVLLHPEVEDEARVMFSKKLDKWERKQKAYKDNK